MFQSSMIWILLQFVIISIFISSYSRKMALRAVAEDPLTSDDNLLIDDFQDNNSDESSMAKDTNCFMRETITSLHW